MAFSGLYIGYSALAASQRAVETAAHNVANANTPGYTRQRLAVQTAMPTVGTAGLRGDGMRGNGVTVLSIDRLRDRLADVSWRVEAGVEGQSSARLDGLNRTEAVLSPYADGTPEALSTFLSAWDGLSLSPADSAARSTVLSSGDALATSLRDSSAGLDRVSGELSTRVGDATGELNGLLKQVAALNGAIQRAKVGGADPNDLYDTRDNALDRITQLTGATVGPGDGENVDVTLGDVSLVHGLDAAELVPDGTGADLSISTADGDAVAPGGQLGGLLSVLKADLPANRTRLDALAVALRDAANAVHHASTDLDGNSGGDFFTGDGAADLRVGDLSLSEVAAARSSSSADGEGALAMSALRTQTVLDGATLGGAVRAFSAQVGQAVTDARRSATTASSGLAAATLSRTSGDGVNIDEEMVDLVKYQHAYSAASRVISVVDEMVQRIIDKLGS